MERGDSGMFAQPHTEKQLLYRRRNPV